VGFGVAQVQPIPAIILAQALNGVLLPIVAIYLLLMVNNAAEMGTEAINGPGYNALMGIVVFLTIVLGVTNLLEAVNDLVATPLVGTTVVLATSLGVAVLLAWPIGRAVMRLRTEEKTPSGLLNEE
ncbi:MAG: hypothetical protein ABEL51_09155, partial [Salinibacter sp.]